MVENYPKIFESEEKATTIQLNRLVDTITSLIITEGQEAVGHESVFRVQSTTNCVASQKTILQGTLEDAVVGTGNAESSSSSSSSLSNS